MVCRIIDGRATPTKSSRRNGSRRLEWRETEMFINIQKLGSSANCPSHDGQWGYSRRSSDVLSLVCSVLSCLLCDLLPRQLLLAPCHSLFCGSGDGGPSKSFITQAPPWTPDEPCYCHGLFGPAPCKSNK